MLSSWSISISLVCPLSHRKTDWPKGSLTGSSVGFPVGWSDGRGWTGCCSFSYSTSHFYSAHWGSPPPARSLKDSPVPTIHSLVKEVVPHGDYTDRRHKAQSTLGFVGYVEESEGRQRGVMGKWCTYKLCSRGSPSQQEQRYMLRGQQIEGQGERA